jgi:hypothetical protein
MKNIEFKLIKLDEKLIQFEKKTIKLDERMFPISHLWLRRKWLNISINYQIQFNYNLYHISDY